MISLLPGPVEIAEPVKAAFHLPSLYHRSSEFVERFEGVRASLSALTNAPHVALFNGSGTLANEAVASCLDGAGVVLVNGEFGARLARQARRWNLPIKAVEWPWGVPWDLHRVARELDGAEWVWAVHLETSTGMLNDIANLRRIAGERGVKVCLDCVSSLGATPIDLNGVWLASGVSGKALGSYSGVAMVFAEQEPRLAREVPAYLDVAMALKTVGPCFTFPSPLLLALEAALHQERDYSPVGSLVRKRLREIGAAPLVDESVAAPIVTTFAPPARGFSDRCRSLGYQIGGESGYLLERGLVQIANMGAIRAHHIEELFHGLAA